MPTKTPKVPNYTEAQTDDLVTSYQACETQEERATCVEQFAGNFKRSTRSIIAKLSKEGVYIKPEKVSKVTGEPAAKKDALAVMLTAVAAAAGVKLVSAEKLSKVDMSALLGFFKASNKAETSGE